MKKEQLKQAVQDFNEQEHLATMEREIVTGKIKALEKEIQNLYDRNHYAIIYKPEYGDYQEFVKQLAAQLRNISHE